MNYTKFLKKNSYVIFLFHGVIKKNENNPILNCVKKHIEVKKFQKIIKALANKGNSISFDDILNYKKNKIKLPPYSYIITFDDGFNNNFTLAKPILEKYKTKAIFYLTTNFIEKNLMSWSDRIDFAVKKTNSGIFYINKKKLFFDNNVKSKVSFLLNLRKIVKNNLKINSNQVANTIQKRFIKRLVYSSNLNIYKKMNWKTVRKLNKNNLFTFGGHSHSHETLPKLNLKNLNKEINISLKLINKNLNMNAIHYAYPDGLKSSFNKKIIKVLKRKKQLTCPTAINGLNRMDDDLFKLKRVFVS